MLSRKGKMHKNQSGFTLIELITVLIILGVILGIGLPKYLNIQMQAEWDADEIMIENIAKAAEVYAAQKNRYENLPIQTLIDIQIIDGGLVLNRVNGKFVGGEMNVSYRNEEELTLQDLITSGNLRFVFDTGNVTQASLEIVVMELIGRELY